MNKLIILMLLLSLTPSAAIAGDFVGAFNINSVPVLITDDPKYHVASTKLQEAIFLQIGLTQNFNKIQTYLLEYAKDRSSCIINEYTPFSAAQVFFGTAVTYSILVKKQVSRSFRDPFFDNVRHTIMVSRSEGTVTGSVGATIGF